MPEATYAIIHEAGHWRISHAGQHFGYYDSAAAAQKVAIETAEAAVAKGFDAKVVLQQSNQGFALVWSAQA